jgi:L-rhamnose mutarotase
MNKSEQLKKELITEYKENHKKVLPEQSIRR